MTIENNKRMLFKSKFVFGKESLFIEKIVTWNDNKVFFIENQCIFQ